MAAVLMSEPELFPHSTRLLEGVPDLHKARRAEMQPQPMGRMTIA